MVHVHPMSEDQDDLSGFSPADPGEAGFVTRPIREKSCPLCRLGCCVQTYRLALNGQFGVALHGTAGSS